MLQKIYDSIGLTGKTAKAKELAQYLPVIERQRTNEKGKRVFYRNPGKYKDRSSTFSS